MRSAIIAKIKKLIEYLFSRDGFTMIEIMIVIAIIAFLAALITPRIMDNLTKAKITKAKLQMKQFELPLLQYNMEKGNYPSTDDGLEVLVKERLFDKIPLDPWKKPYQYRFPGEVNYERYEIWSYGADGIEGGDGFNKDIKSWELDQ